MWFEFLVVNTTVTFRLCCLKFQGSFLNLISVQRNDLCIYVRGSRIANGLVLLSSSFPIQWESLGWLQLDHAGEGECYPIPKPSQPRKRRQGEAKQSAVIFIYFLFIFIFLIQECKKRL